MYEIAFDPVAQAGLLVCARVVIRLTFGRGGALARLVINFAFFLLLSVILLKAGHVPFAAESGGPDFTRIVLVDLTKAAWWIAGANVAVSAVRQFLILEGNPREGRLLQDLVVAIVYIGAFLSISGYVFGIPVGTLIATSGAFAIILGLALQSTLNDLFSGIALKLGRPYTVGDWIVLDAATQGKLVETNWRSTHLVNSANDLVIIPNSALAKARFVNLSSPSAAHGKKLRVRVALEKSPATIEGVLRTALSSSNLILKEPAPSTCVTEINDDAVEVELGFAVRTLEIGDAAQSEIFDLVFRHLKASGLALARAPGDRDRAADAALAPATHPSSAWRLINAMNLFASLTEDEKEALATAMKRRTFRPGAEVIAQGALMSSLLVVRSGVAIVERSDEGLALELRRLSPGDFVGEEGVLMGLQEQASVRAATFVVAYEIPKERLVALMVDRPAIADELSEILAKHHQTAPHAALPHAHGVASLSQRIRMLLRSDHGPEA